MSADLDLATRPSALQLSDGRSGRPDRTRTGRPTHKCAGGAIALPIVRLSSGVRPGPVRGASGRPAPLKRGGRTGRTDAHARPRQPAPHEPSRPTTRQETYMTHTPNQAALAEQPRPEAVRAMT